MRHFLNIAMIMHTLILELAEGDWVSLTGDPSGDSVPDAAPSSKDEAFGGSLLLDGVRRRRSLGRYLRLDL